MIEKKSPKVAVIIAHSYGETFETLRSEIQPKVWSALDGREVDVFYALGNKPNTAQQIFDDISVKFRYSRYLWVTQRIIDRLTLNYRNRRLPEVKRDGNTLRVNFPEGHRYMGVKIIAVLKYLFDQGYEIIYRTTLSTVVIPQNFKSAILSIDLSEPFYGGTRVSFFRPNFVSGANLFLNRKTLEYILENINKWHHWDLDDVAIGKMLDGKIRISEFSSINISSREEAKILDYKNLGDVIHIRCKSDRQIRNDAEIMTDVLGHLRDI